MSSLSELQQAAAAASADWFSVNPHDRTKARLIAMVKDAIAREWKRDQRQQLEKGESNHV